MLEKLFLQDLRDLLGKYNAVLEAEDHYPGYPECGQDLRITACVDNKEIDLGQYPTVDSVSEIINNL